MNFIYDPSLVLYLPLYELDGSSFASKDAYGHICTVAGALWQPNGHYFDGTDDFIDCGTAASLDITDAVTLEAWVKLATTAGSKYLICKGADRYSLYFPSGSAVPAAYITFPTEGKNLSFGESISLDIWMNLAWTYDRNSGSNNWRAFMNGIAKVTATRTEAIPADASILAVGSYQGTGNYFPGIVGEVRIYNRALTPQEIQHNYLATKWRYR